MDHPHLMTPEERKLVLKAWEACIPKLREGDMKFGVPLIYGTSGETPKYIIGCDPYDIESEGSSKGAQIDLRALKARRVGFSPWRQLFYDMIKKE